MALDANAKMGNVKISLDKYIHDNVYTTEGISVDFEGLPFDDTGADEWVQPRIVDTEVEFHRQGSSTQYGETANIMFQVNIFVKKTDNTLSHRHYQIRDLVTNYFKIGQDINLLGNDGVTAVDTMRVREVLTDSALPDGSDQKKGLSQYVIAWELDYTRLTTEA